MPGLVFVNILRMVSPGSPLRQEDLDFYTLGSFDAIRIENLRMGNKDISSLQQLHAINKQMHLDIPVHYDKQPLYLYAADWEAQKSIFDIYGENAVKPMVLTLIQLDDFRLKLDAPEDVIDYFENQVRNLIDADKELNGITYQVFYSLGESNVALVLRNESIESMGRLLFRMRLLEDEEKGVYVLSMCSHCAFPKANDVDTLRRSFESWLKWDTGVRFFTLTDTSYGLNNNWDEEKSNFIHSYYLLGEWDYCQNWPENAPRENANDYVHNILRMLLDPEVSKYTQNLRTAYTIPMIPLGEGDKNYGPSQQELRNIQTICSDLLKKYEGNEDNKFEKLANKVLELTNMYSEEFCEELTEKILSMRKTLTGIVKHLLNLKDGRFQQDLFAFLQPVFRMLPLITEDVCQLVTDYHNPPSPRKPSLSFVADLLDMYIQDTSRLLSELQHLFSVLSVSPHTYMETYGSNMRSIAATCKLLVAYQGIANSISSHFDMTLDTPSGLKKVDEVLLVLPYRSIQQQTRVLYEKARPYNRVAYIRINSSDMFDIPKTLFLLLHECGHNVLSYDFRINRVSYYFRAVIGALVDESCSDYFLHTFTAMEAILTNESDYKRKNKSIVPVIIRRTKEESINSRIKNSFREICVNEAKYMSYGWESTIDDAKKSNIPHLDVYWCGFFVAVRPYAMHYIWSMLKNDNGQDAAPSLSRLMEELVGKNVFNEYVPILGTELEQRKFDDDQDLWELHKLYVNYTQFNGIPLTEQIERARKRIYEVYDRVCSEIRVVFSDIYSDMFAFYMLRLDKLNRDEKQTEAKKYIGILMDQAGFEANSKLDNLFILVRALLILIYCYEIPADEATTFFVSNLHLRKEVKERIEGRCSLATKSLYYSFIEDYAKDLCRTSIQEQRDKQELAEDADALHTMYISAENPNRLKETINSIHHFWMNSTQRQGAN